MKLFSVLALSLVFGAGFLQRAESKETNGRLRCDKSLCAACYLDGTTSGEEVVMGCPGKDGCGANTPCAAGYHDLHCVKAERCSCQVGSPACDKMGPCVCGQIQKSQDGKRQNCKFMHPNERWCG